MVHLWKETWVCFKKECVVEFDHKHAYWPSLVLYLCSIVFVCYLLLWTHHTRITPATWGTLYWLSVLFTIISATSKGLEKNHTGSELYAYVLNSPSAIILSKIMYHALLCTLLSIMGYLLFAILLGNPIQDRLLFLVLIFLVATSCSSSLTLISYIASKAAHNTVLVVVMGFPIVVSILLIGSKATLLCADGLGIATMWDEMAVLSAINCIAITTSHLLFPYIWRS